MQLELRDALQIGGFLISAGGLVATIWHLVKQVGHLWKAIESMRVRVADHEKEAVDKREQILLKIGDIETGAAARDAQVSELSRSFEKLDSKFDRMDQKLDRLIENR